MDRDTITAWLFTSVYVAANAVAAWILLALLA